MTFKKSEITDREAVETVNSKLQHTPIAVIGVASIFPDAKNVESFWDNIINEVDSIRDIPPSRWKIEDYYDPDPKAPDKSYSKWGGFIPDIDFNPMEFGLPPNILEVTDVSQLLALVVAKKVLEDAGYGDETACDRSKIGVTLGVGGGQKLVTPLTARLQYPIWKRVLTNSGVSEEDADIIVEKIKLAYIPWEENSFPGMLGNVIAGRVANRLNLGGTNCVLDAACASSLTAIKLAVSDLLEYRSEIMISGGVDTDNSPYMYLCFSKTPAFSPENKSKPFDAESKGMLVGEGVGMVALKRLGDAERDNDRIYAVLKGIGTSSDGKFKSIYAPRSQGQAKSLDQAYEIAGVSPKTVGLIEAHGTGTVAGDNAEFEALKTVFGKDNPKKQYIALGSVKSQIGHTKAAAGSAGFIKTVLALYHKILPATINVNTPHPKMDIENTPFYINSETRPWFPPDQGYPRRAGISSFGFGGTNFHLVLEEYSPKPGENFRKHTMPHGVVISDSSREKLLTKCRQIQKELTWEDGETAFSNFVSQYRIRPVKTSDARLGFVCSSCSKALESVNLAISALESKADEDILEPADGIYYRNQGMDASGKIVALFSGQGSQYLNMGKTLSMNFPHIMDSFAQMDKLFVQDGAAPLSGLVYPVPKFTEQDKKADQTILQKTENIQPAIGAFSAGLYKILTKAGVAPDYVAGHSFGELTALWAAEVLNDEDYFFLARARGKAMAPPEDENFDAGTMSAVIGDVKNLVSDFSADFPNIVIANHNSDRQVVIAGPVSEVLKANKALKSKGYTAVPLSVSAAFHTPLVGHAQKPFADVIRTKSFNPPKCRVYSNATGKPYPQSPEAVRKILEDHILSPVLFKDEIENIYKDGGRIFVEFGPKNVLTKLVSNILADRPCMAVALNPDSKKCSDIQLRQAVVQLCVAGVPLEDIDTYREIREPEEKKSGLMNVRLNGSNYVSEKTRKAYEDALNDGHKIKQAKVVTKIVTKIVEVPVADRQAELPMSHADAQKIKAGAEKVVGVPVIEPDTQAKLPPSRVEQQIHDYKVMKPPELRKNDPSASSGNPSPKNEKKKESVMKKTSFDSTQVSVLDKIEQGIGQFFNHQGETLKVHSRQIENAREYSKSFYDLMGRQIELLREKPELKIPEGIGRSMEMFHDYQGETLKVHAQYLENQAANSVGALEFMKQQYGAEVEILPVSSYPGSSSSYIKPEIPAQLPVPRIEQGMAEERSAEISKPERKPEPGLYDIRAQASEPTSAEIPKPEAFVQETPVQTPIQKAPAQTPGRPEAAPVVAETSATSGTDLKTLTDAMLNVVAEKTGYPTEMLELEMDMEADLGIDSIKRVEILAAVMDQFPGLPEMNPDELAPLKTLGQVVDKMAVEPETSSQSTETAKTESVATQEVEEETRRSIVKIQILPEPDFLEFDMAEGEICLVTDDGTEMTAALCDALCKKGWKVAVLSFPKDMVAGQSSLTQGVDRILLEDMKEETLESAVKAVESDLGHVGGFIHLDPCPLLKSDSESEQKLVFPENEKDILTHVFLMAKLMKDSLVSHKPADRRFFMTIARIDGKFGISGESSNLISGGLFGLSKTLNLEWPSVFCRGVDIDPDMDVDATVSAIISEIHDPDQRIRETAYGTDGRITLVSQNADDLVTEKNSSITKDSVFLVSGGAKGVTAKCIAQLAADHPCKFILMGRSEYADAKEPAYAVNVEDEAELKKAIMTELKNKGEKPTPKSVNRMLKPLLSDREISKGLAAIRQTGATAEYISADVTDEKAVRESLVPVLEKFGAITGIIHGAGVLADKLIENKSVQDFNAVYSTKINGLKTLLNCVDCSKLTLMAFFSSAAGFYGNEAQADYAVANEILNKSAYRFKTLYPDCRMNTFNWGPWDGGMVTPELRRMFAEKGIDVIPAYAGSRVFADELSSGECHIQILVGGSMIPRPVFADKKLRSYKITRNLLPENNPFLNDHVIGESPVLPTVCASWWMADTCEKLYPGLRFFSCADYRLFKGIVFDNSQAGNYVMDIEEVSKNDQGEAEFAVKIMSQKSDGKIINHYGAIIKLINRIPEMPAYSGFDRSETEVKEGSSLYSDGTLFHGPNFQAIERVINISRDKLTMECRNPEISESDQGQFRIGTFNPFAADPQFQIMLIWVRHYFDAGSLPTKAQLGEHFALVPQGKKFFVSLDITGSSPAHAVADITTHDEDGRVYTSVKGAEVTISKELNSLFAKAG